MHKISIPEFTEESIANKEKLQNIWVLSKVLLDYKVQRESLKYFTWNEVETKHIHIHVVELKQI